MTDYKADGTPTHTAEDGTQRKSRYGSGRQPWDDIKELGWAPHFAAGNVLKYLRRTKDREHSIESARWYYSRLNEIAADVYLQGNTNEDWDVANTALQQLDQLLTSEEKALLHGETETSIGSSVDQHLPRRKAEDSSTPGGVPVEDHTKCPGPKSDR